MSMRNRLFSLEGELIGIDVEVPINFSGINELTPSGSRFWRLNGLRHRDNDLPASEFSCGSKHWCINGQFHRINGPAYIDSFGHKKWYIHDIECTKEQHALLVDIMKLKGLM